MCSSGIKDGAACCAASCGTCGGAGCSDRPGGSSACCHTTIESSGNYCDDPGETGDVVLDPHGPFVT